MKVDRKTRRAIVREARKTVERSYPGLAHRSCVFSSIAVAKSANDRGIPLKLFAGSAFWRAVSDAHDDGVSANRFGYGFHLQEAIPRFEAGLLPEMHAWAGTPGDDGLVVDITTRHWPKQAIEIAGMRWTEPKPPDFFWGTRADLPREAEYIADPNALAMLVQLLQMEF